MRDFNLHNRFNRKQMSKELHKNCATLRNKTNYCKRIKQMMKIHNKLKIILIPHPSLNIILLIFKMRK
jgi:hypothetical protein